ncbi:hypothetical protein ACWCOT_46150 [Nonomuraea bangladeshensis]
MGTLSTMAFAQERPETLRIGRRGTVTVVSRGPGPLSIVPAGHPMGYQDAFNAFVRDVYAGIAGELPERVPTFDNGSRMNVVTSAVLRSAETSAWVTIGR